MNAYANFWVDLQWSEAENQKVWKFFLQRFPDEATLTEYKRDKKGMLKCRTISAQEPNGSPFRSCHSNVKGEWPRVAVYETYDCVWLEDVVEMAKSLAAEIDVPFVMTGTVDMRQSDGNQMDFQIVAKEGKLIVSSTEWFRYVEQDDYECADDLNAEFGTSVSDEEFEELIENEEFCIVGQRAVADVSFSIVEKYTI